MARAYALCAAVVTADNLARHRADLNGAPPSRVKARADDSSDEEQAAAAGQGPAGEAARRPARGRRRRRRDDPEPRRQALLAALRGDDAGCDESEAVALASCLRIAYTALGEHYLTVARVTKAARHFSEGVQLFRGLGDAQTAAWLRGRLAFAQATVAARDGGPSPRKHLKARAAVGSLVEALQAFAETVADEATGVSPSFPGAATISAEHALAEAKRGAARASSALAVMAPPQDAPAALMTAAELAADADDSEAWRPTRITVSLRVEVRTL